MFSISVYLGSYKNLMFAQLVSHYCDYANQLLKFFVRDFETIYGDYLVSYNVHNLIHLAADAEIFSVLDNFSAFQFENYLQQPKN